VLWGPGGFCHRANAGGGGDASAAWGCDGFLHDAPPYRHGLRLALALVAVPIWAKVQRLATPHIFGLALRKLGAYLGFGGLAAGIVFGPIAVYADIRIGQTLSKLVGNEPVYYLARP